MSARRGLTVLELMIALPLVAIVASIGTATLGLLGREERYRRDAIETVARPLAVRRTIVAWLEGAHAGGGAPNAAAASGFQVIDKTQGGREADMVVFTTTAPTPLGTGETTVALYVDADSRTPEVGLTAELTSWPGGPSARLQLDSTVVSLSSRCLTNLLGGRRWVPSWMSPSVLPRAIELQLRGARKDALSPALQMPIVVAMEGGR